MSASLVGSEMCIRDRLCGGLFRRLDFEIVWHARMRLDMGERGGAVSGDFVDEWRRGALERRWRARCP
eukprot:13150135-Alexandrium_andersonii.AAC.1